MFGRKKERVSMAWTCEPGMIDSSDIIIQEVKKLNKEMKRNKMDRYIQAKVQPLPCGMAQMLVWHGAVRANFD